MKPNTTKSHQQCIARLDLYCTIVGPLHKFTHLDDEQLSDIWSPGHFGPLPALQIYSALTQSTGDRTNEEKFGFTFLPTTRCNKLDKKHQGLSPQ